MFSQVQAVYKALRHDLTEATRAMAKRSSDDLKKLASLQSTLVSSPRSQLERTRIQRDLFPVSPTTRRHYRRHRTTYKSLLLPSSAPNKSARSVKEQL